MKTLLKKNLVLVSVLAAAPALFVGCGGSDDESDEPSGGSLDAIAGAIESPTGTVSSETAPDVARAYEESMGVPTAGSRDELGPRNAQDVTVSCSVSGDISVEADSSGESATFAYNDCCEAADCCLNGDGSTYYDTSGSATYMYCASASIDYDCGGLASLEYSYCFGSDGSLVYAIEVEGATFAVTGSISNGTGTLTVTGENGSYTCDYMDYAGSCTSDSGESFTF